MRERRAARELALQALYAEELTGYPLAQVVEDVIEKSDLQGELKVFTKELFMAAALHRDELDKFIQDKSENWDFERIAIIDRLIIRMAICEFKYFDDIPPKVSISEAIEIAKRYSTDDSSAFVNGILDAVLHQIGDSITFKLNRSEANPVGKAE
ncbi:MAG: transcription antitermination factor NusB [Candidatus Marinimicrobia bacterium]|jgi:N utilization substance protein B|nr:transcription antitermination factor NusB [Candidatus Neomarinimicrobiota bacterium]MDD5231656.1 transcription antitermination factor NusB [Candidatus Neomarinimicrobiota bacterium]MDD5540461.1 transcription antitermination factor NusB [Candidatus Neomarinimicrobiota bacterium]